MAKLTIIRPNEWVNQAKSINIYVDGKKAGTIGIEEIVRIDVSTGKHKVVLKNRWGGGSKPLAIDLCDKENKAYEISSNQYTVLTTPFFIVIASVLYHGLMSIFDLQSNLLSTIVGLGLIYLLLFMQFYSRYFMTLKEVKIDESKKKTKEEQARLLRKIMALDEKDEVYEV